MAEHLSFDDRITGLAAYYAQLESVDPDKNKNVRPPFYSSGITCLEALRKARRSLIFDVGCHARVEYSERGFGATDLRTASEEERQARAGILAMMTAPPTPEVFFERAEQVRELLDRIVAGDAIRIAKHDYDMFRFNEQSVTVDTSRELYTVFNGHISGRDMAIQYDRTDFYGLEGPVENALVVALPRMFDEGVVTYPAYAA